MRQHITTGWRWSVGAMVLGGLMLALVPSPLHAQATPGLDHFKCYDLLVPPPPTDQILVDVDIADQFVEERVTIGRESQFCNPVEKHFRGTISGIINPDHHLTFYNFRPITPREISGRVKVSNQFGKQKFDFDSANLLAVPTEKQEPELLPPEGLDHFMCYFISGKRPKHVIAVGLVDQFEAVRHRVLEPFLFCNPASKVDAAGVVYPIENPDAHLTCYKISPSSYFLDKSIVIANQFTAPNTQDLFVARSDLLCVPTRKEDFRLDDGRDDDGAAGAGFDDDDDDDDDDDEEDDD